MRIEKELTVTSHYYILLDTNFIFGNYNTTLQASMIEKRKFALIVVDVQNDFITGSLAVSGGNHVVLIMLTNDKISQPGFALILWCRPLPFPLPGFYVSHFNFPRQVLKLFQL